MKSDGDKFGRAAFVARLISRCTLWFVPFFVVLNAHSADQKPEATSRNCETRLDGLSGKHTKILLPEPKAVSVDPEKRKILFLVASSDIGKWQTVSHSSSSHEPSSHIWIDVTPGISFADKIFAVYRDPRPYTCYAAAALINGLVPIAPSHQETVPWEWRFLYENIYLEGGFHEVSERDASIADVGYIYSHVPNRDVEMVPMHAFVPIPGTTWAFHVPGSLPPAIQPVSQIKALYELSMFRQSTRYFSRIAD